LWPSDIDGCIVEVLGNSRYVLEIGLVCSEQAIGTNTIGTVLVENMSLELNGYEHYSTCCHSYRAITIPIHDHHNRIIAALNLTAPLGTLPDWAIDLLHLGVKYISLYGHGFVSLIGKPLCSGLGSISVNVYYRHTGTFLAKNLAYFCSYSTAAAGYYGSLPIQNIFH
jgi:hypothetical protein